MKKYNLKFKFNLGSSVFCVFCKEGSDELDMIKKLGPMICVKDYYMHENCSVWTSKTYLDENLKFHNLDSAIKNASQLECSFCNKTGAGCGCEVAECKNSYHFLCAKIEGCTFINEKYNIYCPRHESFIPKADLLKCEKEHVGNYYCCKCYSGLDDNKLIICDKCINICIHDYCCDPQVDVEEVDKWFCDQCNSQCQ